MPRALLFWTVAGLAAVAAVVHAWSLRWTCDDAFISFRYAQHFVDGHGLVFNLDPAEPPVEGYSNFAWTMLLALGAALGWRGDALETWAAAWGSLMHGATVWLLALAAWRCSARRAFLPVAALAYAAHHHAASLAPAGLETAMFVLLAVAMATVTIERRCWRDPWLLGCLGVLAAMARPDGALLAAAAGAVLAADALRARAAGILCAYLAPFLVAFLPYLLWRHAYYGAWVPNTFYAKSGGDPYPGQGFDYLGTYLVCYWALLPALAALLLLPFRGRGLAGAPWSGPRAGIVLLLFVLPYVAFVVWVGGDFMFARFLLPVTPLCLLAVDALLQRWPRAAAAAALGLAAGVWSRHEPAWLADYGNPHRFSDNRAITLADLGPPAPPGLSRAAAARAMGHCLRELFAGLPVRLGIAGSHANFAFRADVPVAIECAAGLTDAWIAHLPVPARGMVGHERNYKLYPGYLERRGVHFMLELSYGDGGSADPYRDVLFPCAPVPLPARLVIYDRALLHELRRRAPGLRCADFEQVLDRYLAAMPGKPRAEVARDFQGFRKFYFDHNDDPDRRARFERYLAPK